MKIGIIYHRIDCDGLCSYAVLYNALHERFPKIPITGIGYNHGDELPNLQGYTTIYMADVSLPSSEMLRLHSERRLVWIDHHATTIEDSKAYGYSTAPGLRQIGKGACELCWEFTHAKTEKVPLFVQLLSACDVFDKERFDFENEVLPLQFGVRNRFQLNPKAYIKALTEERPDNEGLIAEGRIILNYIRQQGYRAAKTYGFTVTLAGKFPALCILTDQFGGIPYQEAAKEAGCKVIVCVNRLNDKRYKVSCFAADGDAPIHLGNYLKDMYGGGGHANAAGAVIGTHDFRMLVEAAIL